MRYTNTILGMLILAFIMAVSGCSKLGESVLYGDERAEGTDEISVIPMEASCLNRLSIPVHIDGKAYRFYVDTGAAVTAVSSTLAKRHGTKHPYVETLQTEGAGGSVRSVRVNVLGRLRIGQANIVHKTVMVMEDFHERFAPNIDGILGSDVLRHFVVTFDMRQGTLTLAPQTADALDMRIPMRMERGVPLIACTIGTQQRSCMIDTGFSGTLAISEEMATEGTQKAVSDRRVSVGIAGGDGTLSRYDIALALGGDEVLETSAIAIGHAGIQPLVGVAIWRGGVWRLDYLHGTMSYSMGEDRAPVHQMSGIASIVRHNRHIVVEAVFKPSQAYRAGLRGGDRIVTFNGKRVDDLSIAQLSERLCRSHTVSLEIEREGGRFSVMW